MIACLYILVSVILSATDNTTIGCNNLFVEYLLQTPKLNKFLNHTIAYTLHHDDIEEGFDCLDRIYARFAKRRQEKDRFDINSIIRFHEDIEEMVYICTGERYQHLNSLVTKNKQWYMALLNDLKVEWNKLSIHEKNVFNKTINRYCILTTTGVSLHGIYGIDSTIKTRIETFAAVHSAFEICHLLVTDDTFGLFIENGENTNPIVVE